MMKDFVSTKKENMATICFYLGVFCELLVSASGYAFGGYREPIIIIIGMLFFSLKILLSMKLERDWPIFTLCALFGIICFCFQDSALVLRIALFVLAGRDQKAKDVMKVFFWGTLFIMLVTAGLSALGLHNSMSLTQVFRNEPETRYCFGFFHPNGFSFFFFRVLAMGLYCYLDRIPWWGYGILCIVSALMMLLANSKTGIFGCFLLLLGAFLIRYFPKKRMKKVIFYGGSVFQIAEVLVLIITMFCYQHIEGSTGGVGLWDKLNRLTTGRFYFIHKVASEVPIPWFGYQDFTEATEVGFVNALYNQGILFSLIYLLILAWLYRTLYQKQDLLGMLLVVTFTFYALGEAFLPYANKNIVWMLCIGILPSVTKRKELKKVVSGNES